MCDIGVRREGKLQDYQVYQNIETASSRKTASTAMSNRSTKHDDAVQQANHRSPCITKKSSMLIVSLVCLMFLFSWVGLSPFTLYRVYGVLRHLEICKTLLVAQPRFWPKKKFWAITHAHLNQASRVSSTLLGEKRILYRR